MTGPHSETDGPGSRPISVAELLARNGTIGEPAVSRRRRRRRGDSDAVTVAELTGEIPVIRDTERTAPQRRATGTVQATAPVTEEPAKPVYWSEPEPRWPKSPPQPPRASAPERSAYPRPLPQGERPADRTAKTPDRSDAQSGAEEMRPDPVDHYADIPVDVMDSEVGEAETATQDSAYVRSFLRSDSALQSDTTLFGGQTLADEIARRGGTKQVAEDRAEDRAEDYPDVAADRIDGIHAGHGRLAALWRASLIVLQSILAVAFGAGLFVAFDQLWRWNSIVALVLSVLVILGLVVGVRVVRKTEDIASTLIAVAVGALITLGPLALSLQSG
ncbi:hypothetical protein [Mycobacterium sp.]|uniref:hypothetical protein n=1 Tax=Mycobacterium sp. TaxID=1785 RepID=UPI0025E87775|nr:hypothetical protein [Mycobacterium sp.]MBW0012152.1 hypothetical protein [Mycobacterium sp.]